MLVSFTLKKKKRTNTFHTHVQICYTGKGHNLYCAKKKKKIVTRGPHSTPPLQVVNNTKPISQLG